jgi:hypothetical protein
LATQQKINPITGRFDLVNTVGSTSGASTANSYLTVNLESDLSSERKLTGTAKQIILTDAGSGSTMTLSTPQNIDTSATPTFSDILLSGGHIGLPTDTAIISLTNKKATISGGLVGTNANFSDAISGGRLELIGTTSGALTVKANVAGDNYTINFPANQGGANTFPKNDGSGNLTWSTVAGTGDVVGPSSSTTNTIAKYGNATGKLISGSGVLINDANSVLAPGILSGGAVYTAGAISGGLLTLIGTTSGNLTIMANPSGDNYTITFPMNNGAANTFPKNDGSGKLSWATAESPLTFATALARNGNTVSIPPASATVSGALTETDWQNFSSKVSGTRTVATGLPMYGGGDLSADRTIGINPATASVSGALLAADFQNFSSKVSGTRTINTTLPLFGGGDLHSDRTVAITGISTLGTSDYLVAVNSNATAWQYKQLIAGTNVNISNVSGSVTINSTAGGGADLSGMSFITVNVESTLTNERILTGTTNQITITDNGSGSTIVLSTPQNLHTGAIPTFAGTNLTGTLSGTNFTFTGNLSGGNISGMNIQANNSFFYTSEFDAGTTSSTQNINWQNGNNQYYTLTSGTVTLTFTAPLGVSTTHLRLIQAISGGCAITWPAIVKWVSGVSYIQSVVSGANDIVTSYYNGTNYYSDFGQNFV